MALYDLPANCEYGNLQSEMIRDRLVVGIRDSALSERLQMDTDLTLKKAKKTIQQSEAVHEQQFELKGANTSVDTLNCPTIVLATDDSAHATTLTRKIAANRNR